MLTMASEPWPPSDVGKRTSWTESRETLPCTMPTRWGATKFAGPDAGHTEREGRGAGADWPRSQGAWPRSRTQGNRQTCWDWRGRPGLASPDSHVFRSKFPPRNGGTVPQGGLSRGLHPPRVPSPLPSLLPPGPCSARTGNCHVTLPGAAP